MFSSAYYWPPAMKIEDEFDNFHQFSHWRSWKIHAKYRFLWKKANFFNLRSILWKKISNFSIHCRWTLYNSKVTEPLNNSHVFYFQNLIRTWLSTPKLRFWYIDISFLFTVSRDIKSRIRNSDLSIFKKGRKNRVTISDLIAEIYMHRIVIYFSNKLSLFCFLFKDQDRP